MTTRAFLGCSLLAACLTLGLKAADSASDVKVQASSDLRLAILDFAPTSPERDALHQAFADSLGTALGKKLGGTVVVKVTETDAFRLQFDLKTGAYDAALIVGSNVPNSLKKVDCEILRAVSDSSGPAKVFHMIVPPDDPGLQRMISDAFPDALAMPKFQEALTRSVAIKISPDAVKRAVKEAVADTTH